MAKLDFPYVHWTRNRHGKRYASFRKKGQPRVRLPGEVGSKAFLDTYAECLSEANCNKTDNKYKIVAGTVSAAVRAFYRSKEFISLTQSTQATYQRTYERFCADRGNKPLAFMEARHIKAILAGMAKTPAASNQLLKRLKQLMRFAVDEGIIKSTPLIGVTRMKYSFNPIRTWTEYDAIEFVNRHPPGTPAHLAFTIMSRTGFRKSDAVRFGKQHIQGNTIVFKSQKNGVTVTIPIHKELAAAIALVSDRLIFLQNGQGRPFTANGFGNWMRERCDEAGLPDCSSHGLRKLIAKRLAEAGCSENTISAILGWKNNQQAALYTKDANREKLAREGMEKIR